MGGFVVGAETDHTLARLLDFSVEAQHDENEGYGKIVNQEELWNMFANLPRSSK